MPRRPAGTTIQTRRSASSRLGFENMVPINQKGKKAKSASDVFEFPKQAVRAAGGVVAPGQGEGDLRAAGQAALRAGRVDHAGSGDPDDGKDQRYRLRRRDGSRVATPTRPAAKFRPGCDPDSAATAWKDVLDQTPTDGSIPKCRSRFGVLDQHAESGGDHDAADRGAHLQPAQGERVLYADVAGAG